MDEKGTIRAVGSELCNFSFSEAENKAETIAQKRYLSKLERPNSSQRLARRNSCWDSWVGRDNDLSFSRLYRPNWAIAKMIIAKVLNRFRLGSLEFTSGSEFVPTLGFNSIESKLSRSTWTCTEDNFELWLATVYANRSLKLATRRRFAKLFAGPQNDMRKINRVLWQRYGNFPDAPKKIFGFKLYAVTEMVRGNRFSTVPKNNLVDRPICIEPLANILTQRRIGIGIRNSLLEYGIDLKTTADLHRSLISDPKFATIDLKNASDSISYDLIRYLLPRRVFDLLDQTRSEMTLDLDGEFFFIKKISSMGNGFTFELMSLILYALCRSYCSNCSVFGDDIIIPNEFAEDLVKDLESASFIVNYDKTYINSDYRESCGAHFLDGFGYVESYDFRYPTNMGEVITIINKLSRLAQIYPSFIPLWYNIYRLMPKTLYPDITAKASGDWRHKQDPLDKMKLDEFITPSPFLFEKCGIEMKHHAKSILRDFCHDLQIDHRGAVMHYGYQWIDRSPQPRVLSPSIHWAKILMYLSSGRCCKDVKRGKGAFKSFMYVTLKDGTTFRWSIIVAYARKGKGMPMLT